MQKCYVLFPGKFKPVHYGHISLMYQYLNSKEYDVDLTIIISRAGKEGLTPETSKWFLDKIFQGNKRVKTIIASDPSPIKTVYDMIGQKEYGDGVYAMGTSSKGTDIKRAADISAKFGKEGKFYTPGVEVILFPTDPTPTIYSGRSDMYADAPISSTIVRLDIRNNDYDNFRTAYQPLLEDGVLNENTLQEYFERLKEELLPIKETALCDAVSESYNDRKITNKLFEGGAAGHMMHPYDVDEFTFNDLMNLITDLFAGKIEDITEKLDGQNLFASVNESGRTIFARNASHLRKTPWTLADLMNNPKWIGTPSVQHAFSNAGVTIDKVFKNIPNSVKFFNQVDKDGGYTTRKWVNLEILDTKNFNVIPYVESKISFHEFKNVTLSKGDFNSGKESWGISEDPDNTQDMQVLQRAIDKTNRTAFKAQITPKVIFNSVDKGEYKAKKYNDYIQKLLNKYDLEINDSIADYKLCALLDYINKSARLDFLSGDLLDRLVNRWIYNDKSENITKIAKSYDNMDDRLITKEEYAILRDFDKNDLPLVMKKIMAPLDKLFINVGNEALKSITGLANAGHENEIVKRLKTEARDIKTAVLNSDDDNAKAKLEKSLKRLAAANNELNATEGIVFNYQGKTLKLTGSFAPLNQLFGLKFGKFAKKQ